MAMTGAWSLGLPSPAVGRRSWRSMRTSRQRSARGGVPRIRSSLSPHTRWKPEVDLVDVLVEVDSWCGFLDAFTHAGDATT